MSNPEDFMNKRSSGYLLPVTRIEASSASTVGKKSPSYLLTGDAIRLMWWLEGKVAVHAIADQFPRVMNRIAELWKQPVLTDRYFDELLHDERGTRQGFPLRVLTEINLLRDYYVTQLYPKRVDPWDQVLYR